MILPHAFDAEKKLVNAVVETPRGSRNKYDYDPDGDYFRLKKVLPAGTSFPLDFGFIPHTLAEDGDPIDILILMDFPSYPGCIIQCRCIGVIEAEQKEKKEKKYRNDRIVAVAAESLTHAALTTIKNMDKNLLDDIIHFFEYYNEMEGRKFRFLGIKNRTQAIQLIENSMT